MKLSTYLTFCLLPLFLTAAAATAQPPGDPPRGGIVFDEEMTPLQRAVIKAVNERRSMGMGVPACTNRGRACEDAPPEQASEEIFHPQGRMIGRRMRTETVLRFENRGQRDGVDDHWDRVRIAGPMMGGRTAVSAGNSGGQGRSRRAAMFPDRATNDDRDCFDHVVERQNRPGGPERFRSWRGEAECFDSAGNLIANLREMAGAGGCEHLPTGLFLAGDPSDGFEDDCYDENGLFKQTSLEELIDEDPPEGLDNDGDGRFGEDPPDGYNNDEDCISPAQSVDGYRVLPKEECFEGGELRAGLVELIDEDGPDDLDGDGETGEDPPDQDLAAACIDFGVESGMPAGLGDMVGEECDLTRAIIVATNEAAMEKHGRKIYAADDEGHPMASDNPRQGGMPFGMEERQVTLRETFAVMCSGEGAELREDGRCAMPVAGAAHRPGQTAHKNAAVDSSGSETYQTMMGFTFAPPIVEWGYEISEEACVLGICVEVFSARVGYEFDVAAGLRLPVEVTVSNLPSSCSRDDLETPCALAGEEVSMATSLEPLNFTVNEYREFCQENDLADGFIVGDCDRFAVPEFLDSKVPEAIIPALNSALRGLGLAEFEPDGAELVAQKKIFAGAQVRVGGIRLLTWGLDQDVNLPAMCTIHNIIDVLRSGESPFSFEDLIQFGRDAAATADVLAGLREAIPNCQSFTTPFGFEDGILRTFPFTETEILDVRADCAEALVRGEVVVIDGVPVPICTGLILGVHGASLGIGLGLDVRVGSNHIGADWSSSGDAARRGGESGELQHAPVPEDPTSLLIPLIPVDEDTEIELVADNYDNAVTSDRAAVSIDDFTYFLNALQLTLRADLEFGGILSPIPDLASFNVFSLTFSLGDLGVPIPQHPGTRPIETDFFVENYGLEVDAYPATDNPERTDDDTLRIKPGGPGEYLIAVNNLGSVHGDFDGFTYALSNQVQDPAAADLSFVLDPDMDHDDRIDEDPPGPAGELPAVQDEDGDGRVNEDPPGNWQAEIVGVETLEAEILDVLAHRWSTGDSLPPTAASASQVVVLRVTPFRHFLTAPGLYPVRIAADSRQARELGLNRQDPSGNFRLGAGDQQPGAQDVVWVEITAFFAPEIVVQPLATQDKPGIEQSYTAAGTNGSNVDDALDVETDRIDWNPADCTLTTLGSQAGCPFRAVPTVIDDAWIMGQLPDRFPSPPGLLEPGGYDSEELSLLVPRDWAGMEDTTYELELGVTSQTDPDRPAASSRVVLAHTVVATSESMTRYIGLEIAELIGKIEAANRAGARTGGLLPVALHPAEMTNDRALERVLDGDLDAASRAHSSNIRIMEGFLHALDAVAKRLAPELVDDWRAQAQAILSDLETAAANTAA